MSDLNVNINRGNIGTSYHTDEVLAPPPEAKINEIPMADELTKSEIKTDLDIHFADLAVPSLSSEPQYAGAVSNVPNPNPNPAILEGTANLFSSKVLNPTIQASGGLTLLQYRAAIEKAISDLQKEMYRAEQKLDASEIQYRNSKIKSTMTTPEGGPPPPTNEKLDLSPFISAVLEASDLNPYLSRLMLIKGRLDAIKDLKINQSKDGSGVDFSQSMELIDALKATGFIPMNADAAFTHAELKSLIGKLDQAISKEAKSSPLGPSLQSVLNAGFNGVLPMMIGTSSIFELLYAHFQLKEWGYQGKPETLAADKAIFKSHPEMFNLLKSTGLVGINARFFTDAEIPRVMQMVETAIKGRVEAVPMTALQLITYNTKQATSTGIEAAKHFLEMLTPIQDVLRKYLDGSLSETVQNSNGSQSAKKNAVDMANGAATIGLLKSSLSASSNSVDNYTKAAKLMNDIGASRDLVKAFFTALDYQKQKLAWEALDLPQVYQHSMDKSQPVTGKLKEIQLYIQSTYNENPYVGWGVPGSQMRFYSNIYNLSLDEARQIPEIFAYFRQHPELRRVCKNYDVILADDKLIDPPFTSYVATEFKGSSYEEIAKQDRENLETIRSVIKMLKKILESLGQGGPITDDAKKAIKKVSDVLGGSSFSAQALSQFSV